MISFIEIYEKHYEEVKAFAIWKTNAEEGEEIAQDVFVKVDQNLHKFDPSKAQMRTWIMTFAKNKVIDFYRKKKEEFLSMDALVDSEGKAIFQPSSGVTPATEMIDEEYRQELRDCIDALKEPYRELSHLFFNLDYSYDEIVKETGSPLGSVKGQLSRAKKLLKAPLSKVLAIYQ